AQVAIDFFDDKNGFDSHVHVLLVLAGADERTRVTPDHSVQFGDLPARRAMLLPRIVPCPRRLVGQPYVFDPSQEGELEAIRKQAAVLAAALGIEVPRGAAIAPPRWVVADPVHLQFGQVLGAATSGSGDRFIRQGAVALAILDADDDEEIFAVCENAAVARQEALRAQAGPTGASCPAGWSRRAIESHRPQTADDWVFRVPESLPEFQTSARASGLGFAGHANHYITSGGIPPGSAAAREIRSRLEALRHFIEHDRRIAQMQRAIRGNPKCRGYSGPEDTLASALDEAGGVITSRFDEWVAQEQTTKAVMMKDTGLYAEFCFEGFVAGMAPDPFPLVLPFDFFEESPLGRAVRSAARHGPPPPDAQPREAFQEELLKSSNIYSEGGPFTVRPFAQDEVPLLQGAAEPREAFDLVPDHVRQVSMDPERVRANHPRLLAWLRRLADMGITVATRRKKATAGLFFVERKGDHLRMIADGRQPNLHGLPPQTNTALAEALASAQVGADRRRRYSVSSDDAALHAATVDLKDGFHQIKIAHLSARFAFDVPGVRAVDFGCPDYARPAYGGQAVGRPWALWIRHETPAHAMWSSAGPGDVTVLDKAPAARLERGTARLERVTAALDLLGLKWHGRQGAGVELEIPGVTVDGAPGLVRWRTAAGWQTRAVLGHLVSCFQLLGPGLSAIRAQRDFAQRDLGEIGELPAAALHELRVARSFLFLAAGRWGLPPCPVAFATEASMSGRAPLETDATPDEAHDLCRCREGARLSKREKFVERERDGFRCPLAIGDAGEGFWDGLLERARPRDRAPERCRVEVDSGRRPPPLPGDFADRRRRELPVAGACRDASRMRDYEARCGLMGLARAASYPPCHDAELLSAGGDMGCNWGCSGLARTCAGREVSLYKSLGFTGGHSVRALGVGGHDSKSYSHGLHGYSSTLHQPSDSRDPLEASVPHQNLDGAILAEFSGQGGQRPRRGRRFFLEVFSGEGYLTGATLETGLRRGPQWTSRRAFTSISTADPKVQKECRRTGAHYSLENPQCSRLWIRRPLARALKSASAALVDLRQRRFGAPLEQPTRIVASHPLFATLGRERRRRRRCEALRGKACVKGHWGRKTSPATAYPPSQWAYAGVAQPLAPPAAVRPDGEAELERRWERQPAAACGCDAVG
ncbi:unnamed protein product, partial [Prorocentrum cordatum]